MARIARVVVPGLPYHHVTQRGNRREPVFFEADAANPAPSREWSETPHSKGSCCET
jgi:hypothetical protein